MTAKRAFAYLLLVTFSIYFLCPLLCRSFATEDCTGLISKEATNQGLDNKSDLPVQPVEAESPIETDENCCSLKKQASTSKKADSNCRCNQKLKLVRPDESQLFHRKNLVSFSSTAYLPLSISPPPTLSTLLPRYPFSQSPCLHWFYLPTPTRAPPL